MGRTGTQCASERPLSLVVEKTAGFAVLSLQTHCTTPLGKARSRNDPRMQPQDRVGRGECALVIICVEQGKGRGL